jgi:penicillin-binding protein 2
MNKIRQVMVVVSVMFAVLVLGLFNLQVAGGGKNRELSNKNRIRLIPQLGSRGIIFDRRQEPIVDSRISYDAMVSSDSGEVEEAMAETARILKVPLNDLKSAYRRNFLSPSLPVTVARDIGLKDAIALEESRIDFPQISVNPRPVRNYPYNKSGAHFIGYLNEIDRWRLTRLADYGYKTKDIIGFGGIEEKYDYYLRQETGGLSVEVDHRGRMTRALGFQPGKNGRDVVLTIDLRVQKLAEKALAGREGCVVVMDPYSGEIIAMSSSPAFNPEAFVERDNQLIASYFRNREAPLLNRVISGAYPAGSVFKVVVAQAALENKKVNPSSTFVCRGKTLVGRGEFNCWSIHGPQNIYQAIVHSCNVFFYRTGLLAGPDEIHDYALKFGFGHLSGFDLSGEKAGCIPSPLWRKINKFKNWYDGDTANFSIGQGDVLVTPLQVARMMAVFANRGYLVTPFITMTVDNKDVSRFRRKSLKLKLDPQVIDVVRKGLRGVVAETAGTGNVLSIPGVEVAGKTGTAQAPPGQPHAWFAGFFPYDEPRYVICVFLEHGGPGYYSCVTAKEIIEGMNKEGLI